MKKLILIATIVVLIPSLVFGGRISGTIKEGGRHIGSGKLIEIKNLAGQEFYADTTDNHGSFLTYINGSGKFILTLHVSNRHNASIEIYSYAQSAARYDLILYNDAQNNYFLKRK